MAWADSFPYSSQGFHGKDMLRPIPAGDDLSEVDLLKGCALWGDILAMCRAVSQPHVRIAVLGGSVAAGGYTCQTSKGGSPKAAMCPGKGNAWPAIMNLHLIGAGINSSVYNLAQGSQSITAVPDVLATAAFRGIQPHIVILAFSSNDDNTVKFFNGNVKEIRDAAMAAFEALSQLHPRPSVVVFDEFRPLTYGVVPVDSATAAHLAPAIHYNIPLVISYHLAAYHRYVQGGNVVDARFHAPSYVHPGTEVHRKFGRVAAFCIVRSIQLVCSSTNRTDSSAVPIFRSSDAKCSREHLLAASASHQPDLISSSISILQRNWTYYCDRPSKCGWIASSETASVTIQVNNTLTYNQVEVGYMLSYGQPWGIAQLQASGMNGDLFMANIDAVSAQHTSTHEFIRLPVPLEAYRDGQLLLTLNMIYGSKFKIISLSLLNGDC